MKKFLLSFGLAMMAMSVSAEEGWVLVTDTGSDVPMQNVAMLVAADDASEFSVICQEGKGDVIDGVSSVTFELKDIPSGVTGVENVGERMLLSPVENTIHIMGSAEKSYEIYSISGEMCQAGKLTGQNSAVNISSLASGVYVLRVGKSTLKFTKK